MSYHINNVADTAEELLISNNNSSDKHHPPTDIANDDSDNESESQPCLQRTSSDSFAASINGGISNIDSDVVYPERFHNHPNASFCHFLANRDLNTPIFSLKPHVNAQDLPSMKNAKNRTDRFSIQYSISENKPLISKDDYKMKLEYEKNSLVTNPPKRKFALDRPASLNNISDSKMNTVSKDMPFNYTTSNLAASQSPKPVHNSGTNEAFIKGSLNTWHTDESGVEIPRLFQVQPNHAVKTPLLQESDELLLPLQPFIESPESKHSQQDCQCAMNSSQLIECFQICPHDNPCTNTACPSYSLFHQNNQVKNSTDQGATSSATQNLSSCSTSHQDLQETYSTPNSSYQPNTDTTISVVANSTLNVITQNSESTPVHVIPLSVLKPNECSKSSFSDDKPPLQVLVPRGQVNNDVSTLQLAEYVRFSQTAYLNEHYLNNHVYHQPQSNALYSAKSLLPHKHNASNSVSMCDSPVEAQNQVSHINIIDNDGNVSSRNKKKPTGSKADKANTLFLHGSLQNDQLYEDRSADYPHVFCNHINNNDRLSDGKQKQHKQIQVAVYPELTSTEVNRNLSFETSFPNTGCAHCSLSLTQNENISSSAERYKVSDSETACLCCPKDACRSNKMHLIQIDTSESNAQRNVMSPHSENTSQELHHCCSNSHECPQCCTTSALAQNLSPVQTNFDISNSRNNADHRSCSIDQNKRLNQKMNGRNNIDNANNIHNTQTRGVRPVAGLIQCLPTSYFDAPFMGSQENLVKNKRTSARSSMPSSIESGHPMNREGSPQRSNSGELALTKINTEVPPVARYSDREVPDYVYLCVVATVLNPLFGLAAFLFNYYARQNYQQHKPAKANNFYFAAITISTVGIFLTLVGAALLITHSIVTASEKKPSTVAPSSNYCERMLFGYDETLQKFFDLDFNMYCEITKNGKIMEALKHYWVENLHNSKLRRIQPKVDCDSKNCTKAGKFSNANDSNNGLEQSSLNSDINKEQMNIIGPSGDLDGKRKNNVMSGNVPPLPKSLKNDKPSQNTVLSSPDGPLVAPGLEDQYKQYMEGNKRAIVGNVNPFFKGTVSLGSAEPPAPMENTPTPETTRESTGAFINTSFETEFRSKAEFEPLNKLDGNVTSGYGSM